MKEQINNVPLVIGFGKGRGLKESISQFKFPGNQMVNSFLDPKSMFVHDNTHKITLVKVRHADLNWMLTQGHINVAVGSSVWFVNRLHKFKEMPFDTVKTMQCRLSLIAKKALKRSEVNTVATKFPDIAKTYFLKKEQNVTIKYMQGCHENALMLGFADAIIDIIETGNTVKRMNLVELDTLMEINHQIYILKNQSLTNVISKRLNTFLKKNYPQEQLILI